MNCGRTGAPGLLNRFDKQLSADRNLFGLDGTDVEPHDVAVARREIEHFPRSNQYAERGGAFDHFGGVKAGWKMDPKVDSVSCGPHYNARYPGVSQDLDNTLASSPISMPDAG